MKIYISGGIQYNPNHREEFAHAHKICDILGHEVINPLEVGACESISGICQDAGSTGAIQLESGHTWRCYLKYDLMAMLRCDAICMLGDWTLSHGARLEHNVAAATGLLILDFAILEGEAFNKAGEDFLKQYGIS